VTAEFTPLDRSSAAAQAMRQIQEMIVDGRLAAGQRLPAERELSEMLQISRPTLRETIRSLVSLNILESRHGSGTYVAALDTKTLLEPLQFVMSLSVRTVDELFEARLLIEPALAALAAARADAAQVAVMRAVLDNPDRVATDVALHRLVADAAGNAVLAALLQTLSTLGQASRALTATRPGMLRRTAAEHRAIVDAIDRRDPDAARAAMTEHLERVAAEARRTMA
jgi:DNA-binding FadR family transcriptional regulator